MDQAVDQIDDATKQIQEKLPLLRLANIDDFESSIRRALLIMYDEPDQWRIRALRIVMGKLMAVCFPLVLQSQRWASNYQKWWGVTRVRVVADHKWLVQAGMCQESNVILSGFEHMDVMWMRYREVGWEPSDDRMFPMRAAEDPPASATSAPPTSANGKKRSKAIPIVDPSGNIASIAVNSAPRSTSQQKNHRSGEPTAQLARRSGMGNDKGKTTFKAAQSSAARWIATAPSNASPALGQSAPHVEDPFTASSTPADAPIFLNPHTLLKSSATPTHILPQPYSVFPPASFMRPPPTMAASLPASPQRMQGALNFSTQAYQPSPVLPWLPDGPFCFAETSTGVPARSLTSKATDFATPSSVAGALSATSGSSSSIASATTSVLGEDSSASADTSSIDPLDSPTHRLTQIKIALDGVDDEPVDQHDTPRASGGNSGRDDEAATFGTTLSEAEAIRRAPEPNQTTVSETASEQVATPTAAPATLKATGDKKKA